MQIQQLFSAFDQQLSAKLHRRNLNDIKLYHFFEKLNLPKSLLGESVKNRKIFSVNLGSGKKKVLIWSQMHGNEPSSTLALTHVLEFLYTNNSLFTQNILKNITISAIPMLNPDGAQTFQRRNAINIDLNRDAKRRISPESQLLYNHAITFKPQWAFNLHDQELYYGNNSSTEPTALALLASSIAPDSEFTLIHEQAKALVAKVYSLLKNHINISKYSDQYMPTAFGDTFANMGMRTILFETGYIIGDNNRYQTTKYHAAAILMALHSIAESDFNTSQADIYNKIPANIKHKFYDIILRNIKISTPKLSFIVDIALCRDRRNREHFTDYDTQFLVYDIGDLADKKAFIEKNLHAELKLNYVPKLYTEFKPLYSCCPQLPRFFTS